MQDGSWRNGVHEGSSDWNSIQTIGKHFQIWVYSSIVLKDNNEEDMSPAIHREKTMLWDQKLRYISKKVLWELHGKNIVEGMCDWSLDFHFCEHCIYS